MANHVYFALFPQGLRVAHLNAITSVTCADNSRFALETAVSILWETPPRSLFSVQVMRNLFRGTIFLKYNYSKYTMKMCLFS